MRAHFTTSLAASVLASSASVAGVPSLDLEVVTNIGSSAIVLTHSPDDPSDRIYVMDRNGGIQFAPRSLPGAMNPFMTIPGVDTFFEGGALGLAFHPDYETNQLFYVYYTEDSNPLRAVVSEFTTMNGGANGDTMSERRLLTVEQNAGNHNGGWIGFSPNDGFLYISLGDDASSSNGQNMQTLKGKVLRIDVDGDDFPADPARNYAIPADNPFVGDGSALDEIWVSGLRNPYRCSFDRMTGDLYIADVGQGAREEISVIPATSAGGENLGWACREGTRCNSAGCCNNAGFTDPIFEYTHANGCSITGGHVYRGCAIEGIDGRYFFADLCRTTINSLVWDGAGGATGVEFLSDVLTGVNSPVGFGEDSFGEIYICTLGGTIFKIVSIDGAPDKNGDGIPDACVATACQGDCDQNGTVNFSDLVETLFFFGSSDSGPCDTNNSGTVEFGDLIATLFLFGPCP